jgi:fatty-acyl-CoA synthase
MRQVEEKMFMKVTSVYGLTEASPGMTHTRIDDPFEVRCTTVGRDFEFTEVKVIDPETGEECPVGVQGEMCNRGYNTMKGYYKMPDETAEVFTEDGFLHTGDLGYIKGNHIFLVGRRKNLIILSNGENISPEEIENKFADFIEVKEVIVFGENDKLIAEIYPDDNLVATSKLEDIEHTLSLIVDKVNLQLNSDRAIYDFRIRNRPFERTSTGKIKRTEFYF